MSCEKGVENSNISNKITLNEANDIVLKHTKLEDNQVSVIKAKYDVDDGIEKYDIKFYYNNKEYNYEINAFN